MEWEVKMIEWLQSYAGTFTIFLGKALAFIGDEKGLLILILAVMFCFKKETGRIVSEYSPKSKARQMPQMLRRRVILFQACIPQPFLPTPSLWPDPSKRKRLTS